MRAHIPPHDIFDPGESPLPDLSLEVAVASCGNGLTPVLHGKVLSCVEAVWKKKMQLALCIV